MIEIIEKIIQELEKMDPRYYDSVLNFVRDSNKEGCAKDLELATKEFEDNNSVIDCLTGV
jgi:hypothetical protein